MANFTLDKIRQAAEAKFGNMDIEFGDETVTLLNPLRLSKEDRAAFAKIGDQMSGDEEEGEDEADQVAIFEEALRLAAADKAAVEKLIEAIGGDLTVLSEVFSEYVAVTQAGEASASQS